MKKSEQIDLVEKLLAKSNKASQKQMSKYGFVFEKGFEAWEVEGRCAKDSGIDLKKDKTYCVKVGDPVIFDATYVGAVDIIVHHESREYNGRVFDNIIKKDIVEVHLFEQEGKYAIISEEAVISVQNYIELDFEDFELDEYKKQVE